MFDPARSVCGGCASQRCAGNRPPLTLDELLTWCLERNEAIMSSRDLRDGLATWWDLAEAAVQFEGYQHLLFSIGWPYVTFQRQFFIGETDIETAGFCWELACEERAYREEVVVYGARPEEVCDLAESPWYPWNEFRDQVGRYVERCITAGCVLSGKSVI